MLNRWEELTQPVCLESSSIPSHYRRLVHFLEISTIPELMAFLHNVSSFLDTKPKVRNSSSHILTLQNIRSRLLFLSLVRCPSFSSHRRPLSTHSRGESHYSNGSNPFSQRHVPPKTFNSNHFAVGDESDQTRWNNCGL